MEPALDDDVTAAELDAAVRRDLRGLQKDTADTVARHLVAAGSLVDDDPGQALEHARYARHRASRIAVVREAAGIAAYHAGEWNEALGELRAARRMGGGPGHLAVMADIERALGRPERAIELSRASEAGELDRPASIELAIVAAGARRDLGELDAAVVGLQLPELDPARRDPWSARLFYAYADNLLAVGRTTEAEQWFLNAADADEDGTTDAAHRLAALTGDPLPEDADDVEFGEEAAPVDAGAGEGRAETPASAAVVEDQTDEDEADQDQTDEDEADQDQVIGDEIDRDAADDDAADEDDADEVDADEVDDAADEDDADEDDADEVDDAADEDDADEVVEVVDAADGEGVVDDVPSSAADPVSTATAGVAPVEDTPTPARAGDDNIAEPVEPVDDTAVPVEPVEDTAEPEGAR